MNKKNINEFYAYSWHIDEEYQDDTFIRIYGLDENSKNVCVSVNGFEPFVWVELPLSVNWKDASAKEKLYLYFNQTFPRIKCVLKFCKKLYGANIKKTIEGAYTHKLFPFLLCSASSIKQLKFDLVYKFKNKQNVSGLGYLLFTVHGQDACPRLQLTSKYNLPTAGWIEFKGKEVFKKEEKYTSCAREFLVDLTCKKDKNLIWRSEKTTRPTPLVLSFDLEVNSEDVISMPKANKPGDVVFQISCVFSRLGEEKKYDKFLLSLGNPKEDIVGATILSFASEKKLLLGFKSLINEKNPNVVIGYNIFNFDIPYLMDRANFKNIFPEWSQQGFPKDKSGVPREIKWTSSAYKNQEFKFLDCEGRLYIDLLPVVQRDFKLNDYTLKTVSTHFLRETKDDLDPKSIFKCYKEGIKNNSPTASAFMSICGKYCMQDSMLVIKLMEKLNVWFGLSEMAEVCNVPMITLFTKGQQIKVYSKLYKYCLENKIVPEKDGYSVNENERYVGAYVFPPIPGLYENVVALDFNALYPNLIIAYNIDYSTCAFDPNIPDELCHVMEWEDHISCKHDPKIVEKARLTALIDSLSAERKQNKVLISEMRKQRSEITKSLNKNVMCEKRRYRFLKTTDYPQFKGVLPTVVQSLLDARKETRNKMNKLKTMLKTAPDNEKTEIETTISILNQRQLAYKISANSMYGITGVKAGILPFMPAAMTITYMGRKSVLKAAAYGKERFNGKLVASDTDSTYFSFQGVTDTTQLWDHAIVVAEEISSLFPPPMKIEFEDAVYKKFLILTKKRYMYQSATRDGTINPEIGKRGVVLTRRDNSAFIRNTYENIVKLIFDNRGTDKELQAKVIDSLNNDVQSMFSHQLKVDDFIITKSTGDYGNLKPQFFLNEKGIERALLGQYNVPFLTDEIKETENIETLRQEEDWYLDKLPAHIQLLEKIKRRGGVQNEGCRLEYVIIETNDIKDKQSAKIETVAYYTKNKRLLNLDYLYYLHRCVNPIDQILEVVFDLKNFVKNCYNFRLLKKKTLLQVNELFAPVFNIQTITLFVARENHKYKLITNSNNIGVQGPFLQSFMREVERPVKVGEKFCIAAAPHSSSAPLSLSCDGTIILKLDYIPLNNLFLFLKSKYGATTSLKTKFVFEGDCITLGEMTEAKLLSVIKRECKKTL